MTKQWSIIPFFIPHQGCPHACVFCNQRKISGQELKPTGVEVASRIREYLRTIPSNRRVEVAFYGGSFTGVSPELQEELLWPAFQAYQQGWIDGIRVSTRPDLIDQLVVRRLINRGVKTIELGVQSLDPEVLQASRRGHGVNEVAQAVEIIREAGLNLGLQMMIGLPRDNRERALATGQALTKLGPDFVRIYPTVVIRDTYLHKMLQHGDYRPLTVTEAVDWATSLYLQFAKHKIPVIRIGLQPTENLLTAGDLVAGPFHPAFGELVEAAAAQKQLTTLLNMWADSERLEFKPINRPPISCPPKLTLFLNPRYWSRIVGQKRSNLIYLERNWQISLKLQSDDRLPLRDLRLKSEPAKPEYYLSWEGFLTNCRI